MKKRWLTGLIFLGVALMTLSSAYATEFAAISDRLSYSGTVTVYNSLSDAQNGQNAAGVYTIPGYTSGGHNYTGRDLSFDFSVNDPLAGFDTNKMMTAWFYTNNPGAAPKSGEGNPNNTNTGFFQVRDGDGSTLTNSVGGWLTNAHNQFYIHNQGGNTDAIDGGQLWDAPNGRLASGSFLNYDFELTAGFDQSATNFLGDGWFSLWADPTAVDGKFTGLFKGDLGNDQSQYYAFDFTLGLDNWAYDNRGSINGGFSDGYIGYFGSPNVVPEPATLSLLAIGSMAVYGLRRRRVAK